MITKTEYTTLNKIVVETKPTSFKDILVYKTKVQLFENDKLKNLHIYNGLCNKSDQPNSIRHSPTSEFCLAKKEFLDAMQRYGWGGKDHDFAEHNMISKDPFEDIKKKDFILIKKDGSNHMIFDPKGVPYPVGRVLNYLDNTRFNLKKALEILKKHPHIRDLSDIKPIPYYNVEGNRNKHISCMWCPDRETYIKAWDECLKDKRYPSTRFSEAIFNLDLLGLRAGGAAKLNQYYQYKDENEE